MRKFSIDIVESITGLNIFIRKISIRYPQGRCGQQIHPAPSHTKTKGSLIFDDRSLQLEPAIQQSDGKSAMIFFHVPLLGTNIDDRRRSSSIACRKTTLIEVYILHHVRIECRKQSAQMIDLIQRSTVQQKHILIIPPAMYIQPGKQFRAGRNTRQVLNGLDKIRRT